MVHSSLYFNESIAFYHPCHCGDFNKQSGCP
ncbi:hypothetical protein T12_13612 [Trichinella patagoniensis]|uniref:Uncharacterized protein n=1 Tax=Trichinella patagoniensis TaxID=990121 RepID=A0A0V0YTG7_9BILA|nr:hypothetical protein T12_1669 [Trichinella patagoniensis]KRY03424.1 hypothetical protein T12_13612 [Trichinella patagoniensis]